MSDLPEEKRRVLGEILRFTFTGNNGENGTVGTGRDPGGDDRAERRGHHEPSRELGHEIGAEAAEDGSEGR